MLSIGLGIFGVVLTIWLMEKNVNIGLVLLIDSVIVFIATNMPLSQAVEAVGAAILSDRCLGTIAILILVMALEQSMREEGMMSEMATHLKGIIGNGKAVIYCMPALIGMLPSPGGARFSCPMVEEVAQSHTSNETKAFVNYWFRHVWQDAFILYPGVIAAAKILDIPVLTVSLPVMGVGIFYALVGYLMTRREVKAEPMTIVVARGVSWKGFWLAAYPVLVIIVVNLLLTWLWHTPYDVEIASIITLVALMIQRKIPLVKMGNHLKRSVHGKYILIITGVMIFMEIFNRSGLVDNMLQQLATWQIPRELIFILLPMIAGFTSGFSISLVSLSFPILAPMGLASSALYVTLAYVSGFIGIMISPLHLCGTMSADYFSVKQGPILWRVLKGEFAVIAFLLLLMGMKAFI